METDCLLGNEGYPIEAFVSWSQKDPEKARITDFEGKWQSFQGNGITGATIMDIAKQQGFVPKRYEGDGTKILRIITLIQRLLMLISSRMAPPSKFTPSTKVYILSR